MNYQSPLQEMQEDALIGTILNEGIVTLLVLYFIVQT